MNGKKAKPRPKGRGTGVHRCQVGVDLFNHGLKVEHDAINIKDDRNLSAEKSTRKRNQQFENSLSPLTVSTVPALEAAARQQK